LRNGLPALISEDGDCELRLQVVLDEFYSPESARTTLWRADARCRASDGPYQPATRMAFTYLKNSSGEWLLTLGTQGWMTYTRCQYPDGAAKASAPLLDQAGSFWSHNGSIMALVSDGASRAFYYLKPRPGMIEAGAQKGSLLFSGETVHDTYKGTAVIYNKRCGQIPYEVSGPILENGRKVVLQGLAPRIDNNCTRTGYLNDTLEFTLLGR
jgi:hypothetical protein